MRFVFLFFIFFSACTFAQKTKWSPVEIKNKVSLIQKNCAFSDSLVYIDSTCTYLKKGTPYSGYVIHFFDSQHRFNLFFEGKYYGEEWIFDETSDLLNIDSLITNLREFRIRCDTNEFFMVVTSYYDFPSNSVHEVYIDHRYKCALTVSPKFEAFDVIFGGDDSHELPYRSFYENGNKKQISNGYSNRDGKRIEYYENGKKESVSKVKNNGESGLLKEFDEKGKCTKRLKYRNNKLRGVYVIMGDKVGLSIVARRQQRKSLIE